MRAQDYNYEMESRRGILIEQFKDLGYLELSYIACTIEGYDNIERLGQVLYKLARDKNRWDIVNAVYFEGWIYTEV